MEILHRGGIEAWFCGFGIQPRRPVETRHHDCGHLVIAPAQTAKLSASPVAFHHIYTGWKAVRGLS